MRINRKTLVDYWGVLVIILGSGSYSFAHKSYVPAFIVMLLTSLFYLYYDKHTVNKHRLHTLGFIYCLIYGGIIFVNRFVIHTDVLNHSWVSWLFNLMFSFVIICRYPFYIFKRICLNILTVLAIFSLIVFGGVEMELFTPQIVSRSGEEGQYLEFFFHCVGWDYLFHRNAGLFHEPGAYQYFLNFAFILFIPEIKEGMLNRKEKWQMLVIVVTLLTTLSTMAYIAFLGIASLVIFFSKYGKMHKGFYPIAMLLIFGLCIMMINSPVVARKIAANDAGEEHISKVTRTRDLITQFEMTLEQPIWGYGIATRNFEKRNYGNAGGCIGLVNNSASLGLLWLVIFLCFAYRGIKRMQLGVPTILVLLIFILIECNENFVDLPITYLFILNFLNYQRINVNAKIENNESV